MFSLFLFYISECVWVGLDVRVWVGRGLCACVEGWKGGRVRVDYSYIKVKYIINII